MRTPRFDGRSVSRRREARVGKEVMDARRSDRYLRRLTIVLALAGIIAAPIVPFAFHFATAHFFTSYHVNSTMLLLLYGAAVFDVANFYPDFLLTVGKIDWFIAIHIAGAALLASGCLAVVLMHGNLVICAALAFITRIGIVVATAMASHKLVREQSKNLFFNESEAGEIVRSTP